MAIPRFNQEFTLTSSKMEGGVVTTTVVTNAKFGEAFYAFHILVWTFVGETKSRLQPFGTENIPENLREAVQPYLAE